MSRKKKPTREWFLTMDCLCTPLLHDEAGAPKGHMLRARCAVCGVPKYARYVAGETADTVGTALLPDYRELQERGTT